MDKGFSDVAKRFRTAAFLSLPINKNKCKKTRIAFSIFEESVYFFIFSKNESKPYNWEELEEYDSFLDTATELDGFSKIEGTDVDEWIENIARRVAALLSASILKSAKKYNRFDWCGVVDVFNREKYKEIFKKHLKDYLTTGGFFFKKEEDGKKYTLVKHLESFKYWKEF